MLVRGTDSSGMSFEEKTSSENLCRGGAAFATHFALDVGTEVEIHIANLATTPDSEYSTRGRIVHRRRGRNDREQIVGVEFTGPRFHRMFVSESTS